MKAPGEVCRGSGRDARATWRLNSRLALLTVAILAVTVSLGKLVHRYQQAKLADSLANRAERLEQGGRLSAAVTYLARYLEHRPEDAAARVRLAKIYRRLATTPRQKKRAIQLFYQAVGLAPEMPALRRQLAELLFEVGQYSAAEEQARLALEIEPDHPEARKVLALALDARFTAAGLWPETVMEAYRDALEADPGNVDLTIRLVNLLEGHRSPDEAVRLASPLLAEMIRHNAKDPLAYLARYEFYKRHNLPGASADLAKAAELDSDIVEKYLAAAGDQGAQYLIIAAGELGGIGEARYSYAASGGEGFTEHRLEQFLGIPHRSGSPDVSAVAPGETPDVELHFSDIPHGSGWGMGGWLLAVTISSVILYVVYRI